MTEKYVRCKPKNIHISIDNVMSALNGKHCFIEIHEMVEMLNVNLADKYFREVLKHNPLDAIAGLIQYDVIHLYNFDKLLEKEGDE